MENEETQETPEMTMQDLIDENDSLKAALEDLQDEIERLKDAVKD